MKPFASVKYLNDIAGAGIGDAALSIAIAGQMRRRFRITGIYHGIESAHAYEGTRFGIPVGGHIPQGVHRRRITERRYLPTPQAIPDTLRSKVNAIAAVGRPRHKLAAVVSQGILHGV